MTLGKIVPQSVLDRWQRNDISYINNIIARCLSTKEKKNIVEYIEENRFMPAELSPIPGPYRYSKTPYLREIVECFDAKSAIQTVYIMKGAQIGATVGIDENFILYIIGCNPGSTLFLAHTHDIAKEIFSKRIDPAIDNAGLREKIKSQTQKKANKSSGDTSTLKEFEGGFIIIGGLQSISRLKAFSIQNLIITEADEAAKDIGGQGGPISLAEKRQDAYSLVKKTLIESTPKNDSQISNIEPRFLKGDQRYYHVPCKHCGELQTLEFENLKYEIDIDNRLVDNSVYYECKFCKGIWKNSDKEYFLTDIKGGGKSKWVATAKSSNSLCRSYHISSLYAPVGFKDWEEIIVEFLAAKESEENGDNGAMKVFTNQTLGKTYKEIDEAPPYEYIKNKNSGSFIREYFDYDDNLIQSSINPNDLKYPPLFCTIASDIQKNYIEASVVLWALGMRCYTIGYHRFMGDTSDINNKCWLMLEKLIKSKHCDMYASITFVDYGYNSGVVSNFCEKLSSQIINGSVVFPVKGSITGNLFRISNSNIKRTPLININVNESKSQVYARLSLQKTEDENPPLWCEYASDLPLDYFQMLTAEEKKVRHLSNGRQSYEWILRQGQKRNEALDIMGYNIVAAYFLCDNLNIKNADNSVNWDALYTYFQSVDWLEYREIYQFRLFCSKCGGSMVYSNDAGLECSCDICTDGYFYY